MNILRKRIFRIVILSAVLLPFFLLYLEMGWIHHFVRMIEKLMGLDHDIFFFLILILVFVLWILVRALWHFHFKKNPIAKKMSPTFFFVFIILLILFMVVCGHSTLAYCDARGNSPAFGGSPPGGKRSSPRGTWSD